jgi:hypothetical protein
MYRLSITKTIASLVVVGIGVHYAGEYHSKLMRNELDYQRMQQRHEDRKQMLGWFHNNSNEEQAKWNKDKIALIELYYTRYPEERK